MVFFDTPWTVSRDEIPVLVDSGMREYFLAIRRCCCVRLFIAVTSMKKEVGAMLNAYVNERSTSLKKKKKSQKMASTPLHVD